MSGRILIDTNIFIYLTKGDENVIEFIQNKNIFVSFITELELLSFKNINSDEEIEFITKKFDEIPELYIADGHHRSASAELLLEQNNT